MIYLLDTDAMILMIWGLKATGQSQHHRTSRKRARILVERCKQVQVDGHSIGVSAVTVSELEYGAWRSNHYEHEVSAVRKVLMPFDTYAYDAVACAEHYGRIRYELETKGKPIGALDLLIAAHALSLGATLVSNNEKHFGRVRGLAVENWLISDQT